MAEQRHPGERNPAPAQAEEALPAQMPFYLSFLSLVDGSWPQLHELLICLRQRAENYGWRRLAACYALTDVPEQVLEVYRVPDINSLATAMKDLGRDRTYGRLVQICRSRQLDLTVGLPYDPGAEGSGEVIADDRPYFLQECLTLKADQQRRFFDALQEVRKVFYRKGWSLVSASRSLTPPYRVMHLWRFGIADQLAELMRELPQEPRYAELEDCCESQWQRLAHKLKALPETWLDASEARRR